jgi:hypothetical protein
VATASVAVPITLGLALAAGCASDDDGGDDNGDLLVSVNSGPRGWERPPPDDPNRVVIALSQPLAVEVSVRVTTVDGTAVAPADYAAIDEVVSVPAGAQTVEVPLVVVADRLAEPAERFAVTISEPSAGRIRVGRTEFTIRNGGPRSDR